MTGNRRWIALIVLCAVLLATANVGLWVQRTIVNEERFTDSALEAFEEASARRALAAAIVHAALAEDYPLVYSAAGGAAEQAVAELLSAPGMEATLRVISEHLHAMLVSDQRPTFVITSRILQAIVFAVALVAPAQAGNVSFDGRTTTVTLFARQDIRSLEPYLIAVRLGGLAAGLLGVWLLAAQVVVAQDRRWALSRAALAALGAFALTFIIALPTRVVVSRAMVDEVAREVVSNVYASFMSPLLAQSLPLLVAGAALWIAAAWKPARATA